jgi:hypothetical protein
MNHSAFRAAMILIILYLVSVAAVGFWMRLTPGYTDTYAAFKDIIPVLIAIAAAALTGCIQRRIAFLTEVRKLYGQCISAVEDALQYTYLTQPDQSQFAAVYKGLASTIELFRGSFRNAGDGPGYQGLYPFEALKSILDWHSYLGFGKSFEQGEAPRARRAMLVLWQQHLRPPVLAELDRWTPRAFISPYWGRGTGSDWPLPPKPPTRTAVAAETVADVAPGARARS